MRYILSFGGVNTNTINANRRELECDATKESPRDSSDDLLPYL